MYIELNMYAEVEEFLSLSLFPSFSLVYHVQSRITRIMKINYAIGMLSLSG